MGWLSGKTPGSMNPDEMSEGTTFRFSPGGTIYICRRCTELRSGNYRLVYSAGGETWDEEVAPDTVFWL